MHKHRAICCLRYFPTFSLLLMFYYRLQDNRNVLDRCFVREARKLMKPKILKSGKGDARDVRNVEYRMQAERACYASTREERQREVFDAEGREAGKLAAWVGRKSRKTGRRRAGRGGRGTRRRRRSEDGSQREKMRSACATSSFPWLRNVSRSNTRTFDPVRLSFETDPCASRKRSASRTHDAFFSITDVVVV